MKNYRHTKIIELIRDNIIETQSELADMLNSCGFPVPQATVSRDLKQLALIKVPTGDGRQKYALQPKSSIELNDKFVRVLRDGIVSMEPAQNILVIKTVSGMAMAVAAALDAMSIKEMVGCIAGDDTIMCAIRDSRYTQTVINKLNKMIA